jgi:DNA processing protein
VTDSELETAALVALISSGEKAAAGGSSLLEPGGAIAELESRHGLLTDAELGRARLAIQGWARRGISVITAFDDHYPANLRGVVDRPPVLFTRGRLLPVDAQAVAVVGTRRPTVDGLAAARAIAADLIACGYTVTSGLAAGVDTAAHTAALDAGGRTVAVIGTGVDRCYPSQNAALQTRIATRCAVISSFPPGTPPSRRSFPLRNAVMSGISLATVIVEASLISGTRTQARASLVQGRPVLLLADLLAQEWAAELATRSGVHVVDRAGDVPGVIQRLVPGKGSIAVGAAAEPALPIA